MFLSHMAFVIYSLNAFFPKQMNRAICNQNVFCCCSRSIEVRNARVAPTLAGDRRENIRTCMVSIDQNPNLIRFFKNSYYYRKVSKTAGLEMTETLLFGCILFYSRLFSI